MCVRCRIVMVDTLGGCLKVLQWNVRHFKGCLKVPQWNVIYFRGWSQNTTVKFCHGTVVYNYFNDGKNEKCIYTLPVNDCVFYIFKGLHFYITCN